jgi:hypothetical protein
VNAKTRAKNPAFPHVDIMRPFFRKNPFRSLSASLEEAARNCWACLVEPRNGFTEREKPIPSYPALSLSLTTCYFKPVVTNNAFVVRH